MNHRAVAEACAALLAEAFGDDLVTVALYGSVGRGEAREGSDIDLFVVIRGLPHDLFERARLILEATKGLAARLGVRPLDMPYVSIIEKTPEEAIRNTPLYLDMTEDAVLLVDRDGFFAGVLDRLRARMRELGSVRKRIGDAWYWDLKPDYKFGEIVEL